MLDVDMKMFSPVLLNQYRLIIFEKKFQPNCCGHRARVNKRVVNKGISKPTNHKKHKDFINNETSKILPTFKLLVVIVMLAHTIWHIDAAASVTPVSPNKRGKDTLELLKNKNSEPELFELFKKQGKTARGTFFPKKNAYRNDYNHKDESDLISLPEPDKVFDNSGYVADDGQQYDRAELALAAYAASSLQAFNKSNSHMYSNNCPKECTCLNDYFDCAKKHFEHVPAVPDYVQVLDFSGNKLTDETILELRNLTELHKLNLKRNQLENVPKFHGLISLKHLNLASNRIQQLSKEAFEALPSLKSLDVTKNLLHAIHHNVFPEHIRLTHLILNGNKISNIDENAFDNLSNLVDLELNSNKLRILPAGIFGNLTKLKKLALNNNNLEINWSTFRGLHSLQKLQLKSNKIRALQDGVFHVMRSIETIELDHNAITSLSRQGLYNLTKLHHLSLSNNTISRIELDTFEFTQSLTSLDLSYNNITEFKPQHLECLQHLLRLNLGHNKIQYLMENTFDCVKNLEDLNVRRNKLSWVIEDQFAGPPFKSLHNLKRLDLYGNNLKQITTKSLSGLNKLELLNLGGNAIASVQANAFEHMAQLQKLIFKSINFICDCEIVWFRRWLLTNFDGNPQIQKNAVCGYPEHLLDRELITLPKAELVCADTPKPKIIREPSNQLAVKGANITMECFASSPAAASLAATDELKVIWRHDNQNLRTRYPGSSIIKGSIHGLHSHSNTETQIHHDQSKNLTNVIGLLRLYNVSYENAGKYQCVVSNAFGSTYSQKFKISIGIHPKFLQIPKNLTIDSGETARLVCSATGDPTPEIALQKFGGSDFPAATERRLQVIREENAFVITNAKASDTGIYTCTADSAAGEIKVNATLTVNDKPQPSIPKVHKESVLGKVTALECLNDDAVELIDPHREWFKDNKPFHASSTSSSKRYYFTNEKEYLIIRDTQSVDAGQYRCEIMDSSKTFILLSELVVVKEDFNQNVIIIGVVLVTIACILVGSLIIWTIMFLQKKKMLSNDEGETSRMEYIHNESDRQINVGSRGSALDQTQLTSLNQTDLRQIRSYSQRPRSLADLDFRNLSESARYQHNRLLTNGAANYESVDVGITLQYLDNNFTDDLQQQQDQLSSKDSGTGSDAAAKRSIDDFAVALIPKQSSSSARDVNERMGINSDSNIHFDYEIPECDTELCDTHHYERDPDENDRFLHSAVPQHVDDNFRTTTQKSQSSAVGTSRTESPGDYEKNCSKMHSQEVDI